MYPGLWRSGFLVTGYSRGTLNLIMWLRAVAVTVMAAMLASCGGSSGSNAPLPLPTQTPPAMQPVRISADAFTDPLGQHDTEVEPSAAEHGSTIVAAFQVARQNVAGGSAIGVGTSLNAGITWSATTLPGITKLSGGIANSASDAAVAYDAAHGAWLVAVLPIINANTSYPEVSRSTDGVTWNQPVRVSFGDVYDDKEWIACDNAPSSPYFGHCYVSWDDAGRNGLVLFSTTTDGGATWSTEAHSSDSVTGVDAQAVPRPNGDVVVVSDDYNEASVLATVSHDGGITWGPSTTVASIIDHFQAGNLRSGPLISAEADASGTIYALWPDCRFEQSCVADDLVFSTSTDGRQWTPPQRVPLDAIGSGVDHFIASVGVDPSTAGSGAHVGVTYYSYATSACGSSCLLSAAFAASPDGGKTWTAPASPGATMAPPWLAVTTQGVMVADYVATVFVSGKPVSIYAQAFAPGALLNEAIYAWSPNPVLALARRSALGERPVAGAKSDHPREHFVPMR